MCLRGRIFCLKELKWFLFVFSLFSHHFFLLLFWDAGKLSLSGTIVCRGEMLLSPSPHVTGEGRGRCREHVPELVLGKWWEKNGMVSSEAHGIVLVLNNLSFARQSDPNSPYSINGFYVPTALLHLPGRVGDDLRRGWYCNSRPCIRILVGQSLPTHRLYHSPRARTCSPLPIIFIQLN